VVAIGDINSPDEWAAVAEKGYPAAVGQVIPEGVGPVRRPVG
jgi:hypothetical protein